MTITVESISWGKYHGYEGPFFRGVIPFKIPNNPTFADKALGVLASTEGKLDSVNMYDRCTLSLGCVQWCESAQFSVSNMLGKVAESCTPGYVIGVLGPALVKSKATFEKNPQGLWRFKVGDDWVDTPDRQRALFLGCDGKEGSWTDETKLLAKTWAACVANVWSNKQAQDVQIDFTQRRIMTFIMKDANAILFSNPPTNVDAATVDALRAAFISFAANLPAVANAAIVVANKASKFQQWTPGWIKDVLRSLIYNAKIGIYPIRYRAIQPVIKLLFGVEFPTFDELTAWTGEDPSSPELIIGSDEITPTQPVPLPIFTNPPLPPEPTPAPNPGPIVPSKGPWDVILGILRYLLSIFFRKG